MKSHARHASLRMHVGSVRAGACCGCRQFVDFGSLWARCVACLACKLLACCDAGSQATAQQEQHSAAHPAALSCRQQYQKFSQDRGQGGSSQGGPRGPVAMAGAGRATAAAAPETQLTSPAGCRRMAQGRAARMCCTGWGSFGRHRCELGAPGGPDCNRGRADAPGQPRQGSGGCPGAAAAAATAVLLLRCWRRCCCCTRRCCCCTRRPAQNPHATPSTRVVL